MHGLPEFENRVKAELGFVPERSQLEAWLAAVESLEQADVGLALACGLFHAQPEAQAWFAKHVVPRVRAVVRRAGATDAQADDYVQHTLTRVLVERDGARLRLFRGRGSFVSFISTVALRHFTDSRAKVARETSDDDAVAAAPAMQDLERQLARGQNREHFTRAFREALASLEGRERTLLRANLLDGRSIDELAPLYSVSRATVARWLARAREALRVETLRRLSTATRAEGDELESLLVSLQSGFDVSLQRFLEED
jgi:RNA polymerase sigma-70 factor (ECF subfamily)